jgi:hypothetical protein
VAAVDDDVELAVSERRDRVIAGIVTAIPIVSLFVVGWRARPDRRSRWAGMSAGQVG